MNNTKIIKRIILLLGIAVSIYFTLPEIAILISSKKTTAELISWESKNVDHFNNRVMYKYKNEYNGVNYEITELIRLSADSKKIWNKPTFEIEYNKYFPKNPKITEIDNYFQLICLVIFIFLAGFAVFRI